MSDQTAARAELPMVSIIVPVLNEELNIDRFLGAVREAVASERERYRFEFVFTDNHSTDQTFAILRERASEDPSIRVIRFSKNFGYQKSIYCGYMEARGLAAIQLDCDLQDPPTLIPQMLRLWEGGSKVVYGVRLSRKEGWLIGAARRIFYRAIDWLSTEHLPRDAGDFRLVDRRIIDELRHLRDTNIYLRGRIATMGFTQTALPYHRDERVAGESKFSLGKLATLAVDGVVSHSVIPLRMATAIGMGTLVAVVILGLLYLVLFFFYGDRWPRGFATLALLLLAQLGILSMLLGIMGEYIARIYDQLKQRPDAIVEERIER